MRDRDVFAAIGAALDATGQFPSILMHHPDLSKRPGDEPAVIAIKRTGWNKEEIADGFQVRKVAYRATLSVIEDDPETRFDLIDLMENLFLNATDGTSIGGITWPQLTFCSRGEDDAKAEPPEGRVILIGSFAYEITGYDQSDTAD